MLAPDPISAGPETKVFFHRQVGVERELLRHVADTGLDFGRLGGDVEAGHRAAARGRFQETAEHADDSRFARAVGAEKTEDLSRGDVEGHTVHGYELAEKTGQSGRRNHDLRRSCSCCGTDCH